MKYLMILDDQSIVQRDEITQGDFDAVADGYMDIVRFADGEFERLRVNDDFTQSWISV